MSSQITATVHEDSAIQSIRNDVAAKNDGIPFLLLPVRVETRFMTVDRPTVVNAGGPTLLNETYKTGVLLEYSPYKQHPTLVLRHLRKVEEQMSLLREKVLDVESVSSTLNGILYRRRMIMDSNLNNFMKSLDGLIWRDKKAMMELGQLRQAISSKSNEVKFALGGIEVEKVSTNQETTTLINNLAEIDEAMSSVASRDLSTTDRKGKRANFEYVEGKVAQIGKAIEKTVQDMEVNMTASSTQLTQLRNLLNQIPGRRSQVQKNIQNVNSTFKKVEYTDTFGKLGDRLEGMTKDMSERLLAKIELRQSMISINSLSVLNSIFYLNDYLRRANKQTFGSYAEVQNYWSGIQKRLSSLRNMIRRFIDGGPEELEALQFSWDRVDNELVGFSKKIQEVKVSTKTEMVGINQIVSQIDKEYRSNFDALRSTTEKKIESIDNKGLDDSIKVYENALTRLRSINSMLDTKLRDKAKEGLVEFNKEFAIDKRSLRILPNEKYQELQGLAGSIQNKIVQSPPLKDEVANSNVLAASQSLQIDIQSSAVLVPDLQVEVVPEAPVDVVFMPTTVTQKELWVRIFPDDIAIHTHEEALTHEELKDGKAYWYEIWTAGADEDLKLGAWRALVTSYGPERAAWVVRALQPVPAVQSNVATQLGQLSQTTQGAVDDLARYNDALAQGIKLSSNAFDVIEDNLADLTAGVTKLQAVGSDTELMIAKIKKALIMTQSRLTQYFGAINALSDADKAANAHRMPAVQATEQAYNDAVLAFKNIATVTTEELVAATIAQIEVTGPVFPNVAVKDASWTQVPHSKVMPDRFVVAAMRYGTWRYLEVGKSLPQDGLIVGLDPNDFQVETFSYDSDGNLIVDPKIKWMTDFDEAVDIGMGIWFKIDESDWEDGFDRLVVLGIKNENAADSKALLEQLIDNHHFIPEGASFLEVGTPTNNTENSTSGFKGYEEDAAVSFEVERRSESGAAPVSDPAYPTDSERLADALGINHDNLAYLPNSNKTQVSDALNFNKALFHGTVGEFMEEALDTIFTLDNIDRTKAFMSRYVAARGLYPSIRVGTQPYGIMATTAFRNFSWTGNDANLPQLSRQDFGNPDLIENQLQDRYDARLAKLMVQLNWLWTVIRSGSASPVKHSGNVGTNDPQEHFMEMLGLHANSVEHYYYYGLNVAARQNTGQPGEFNVSFDTSDPFRPTNAANAFKPLMSEGYFFTSDGFYDETETFPNHLDQETFRNDRITTQWNKSRVYALRHLAEANQLLGRRVDHRALKNELFTASDPNTGTPEERYLAQAEVENYIDWLVGSNAWEIHSTNRFAELNDQGNLTTGMPSQSLLFLLMRHSILSAHADTIFKVLQRENLVTERLRKSIGQTKNYYARYGGSMSYVTKWTYLFSKIHSLKYVLGNDMDENNSFYRYMDQSSNAFLNRYLSPEHPWYFNNSPRKVAHQPIVDKLAETRDAFTKLKTIPTAQLSQLMAEHLDLCSYRLDSWYLGLVNKRLEKQRQNNSQGIYIGAYGYLEDLRRGAPRTPAGNLPSGIWKPSDGPVYVDGDNQGYIHAPSVNHAITAAILRAGYHSNSSVSDVNNEMAVNLSSARVRAALNMIHGIRNGQSPAAMLGYQFERALHERYLHVPLELDEFIYEFRDLFPLSAPVDASVTLDDAARTNVVNGLELLEFAQDYIDDNGGPNDPNDTLYEALIDKEAGFWAALGNASLTGAPQAKRHAMLREIDRMADTFDALGDVCLSESVYQIAQGNHVRAAAIFDRLSKGDVPDEIMIADTPRTGTVVTHRVALMLEPVGAIDHALTETGPTALPLDGAAIDTAVAGASAAPTGWTSRFSPRALLEPTLNKWAGGLIGDPATIKCLAEYDIDGVVTPVVLTLADLEVQPLDVLHLFGTGPINGGAELNTIVANYVRSQIPSLPPSFEGTRDDVDVTIRFTERDAAWSATDASFYEKAGLIQSLREIVTDSGILSADHVHIPGEEEVPDDQLRNQDLDELMVRVTNALARLALVASDIDNFYTNEVGVADYQEHTFTNGQIDVLRQILGEAAAFGVPGTRTELVEGYGDSTGRILMGAVIGANKAIADRLTRANTEMATALDTSKAKDSRVDALVEAAKVAMGAAFRVIPQFVVRNATALNDQLAVPANKGLMRSASTFALDEWAHGIARVRERMSTLDTLSMHAEAFGQSLPDAAPLQLPFELDGSGDSVDHWLGLEFPTGYTPTEDKLSIVMYNSDAFTASPSTAKVALLLDEWVEIIPNLQETTGLAFNYDQPNAKAPNTILMAVTPTETGSWSWDDLIYTITDTVDLAKNRAVEPEHLEQTYMGQILPGFMYEVVPPSEGSVVPQDDSDALGWQVITNLKANNDSIEE